MDVRKQYFYSHTIIFRKKKNQTKHYLNSFATATTLQFLVRSQSTLGLQYTCIDFIFNNQIPRIDFTTLRSFYLSNKKSLLKCEDWSVKTSNCARQTLCDSISRPETNLIKKDISKLMWMQFNITEVCPRSLGH